MIYVFDDDFNLYWMSDPDVRHSKAIEKNQKIAGTITVNLPKENNLGIQFEGVAEKIDGGRHDLAIKHFTKRKKPAPKKDEDVLQGDSWYIVKPKRVELICEEFFGFEKQKLEL